jgi:hypothetical protein
VVLRPWQAVAVTAEQEEWGEVAMARPAVLAWELEVVVPKVGPLGLAGLG